MSVDSFKELTYHVGHGLECVTYGSDNVVIECLDCNEILISFDDEEEADE